MKTLDLTNDADLINLKVNVNGDTKEIKISMPKWKHSKELRAKTKGLDENSVEATQAFEEYLVSLGLPQDILDELTADQIKKLSKSLGADEEAKK